VDEALVMLESRCMPDLCLVDMMMPDRDGLDFVKALRRSPRWAAIPVVLLSSAPRPRGGEIERWGVAAFLNKPASQVDLLQTLGRVLSERTVPAAPFSPSPSAASDPAAANRGVILLAEDNPVNQRVAQRLLEKRGYRVIVATDGEQAVEKWRNSQPNLILMDLQMPRMDGLEATAEIRRSETATGARVPIVAVTANAMKGDRERCLRGGMDGYVSKPIDSTQLLAMVEALLRPEQGAPRMARPPAPVPS
jgi:CheY-like chemotaxis protein